MDREVNKAHSFQEAEQWDRQQQWAMTPEQRHEIAKVLRDRFYGADVPDIRESERAKSRPIPKDLDDLDHLPS